MKPMSLDCPLARMFTRGSVGLLLVFALLTVAPPALALEPDQIALVVNAKVPASRELAEFYAQKRGIPAGRIIAVDLPFPEEEIPATRYERDVAPAVRKFLNDNKLKDQVTCLVTFWGVPLRIGTRAAGPGENEQLRVITAELEKSKADLAGLVGQAEALAKELDPAFAAGAGNDTAELAKRAGDALTAAVRAAGPLPAGVRRTQAGSRLMALFERLSGDVEAPNRMASPELRGLWPEEVTPDVAMRARQRAEQWVRDLKSLQATPQSPRQHAAIRTLVREHFGLFRYIELLNAQHKVYETRETEAAFDSELALLWWDASYPRYRWQGNPLHYKAASAPPGPRTLMVTRLDGPTEDAVDRIILSGLKAEKAGLKGRVALDGRGIRTPDGYGRYDGMIRNLAALLKEKTKLKVTFDDQDPLFQPGPDAPKDVAVYCGWYSLRNYVPAMKFAEGAVGYHVASLELVSLRTPGEKGWVAGLINDGVVATVGPVAEPYLQSFPPADEFFPLLMTGKLTLAEVYWKTNVLTSWMVTCVGDPLYNPYRNDPAVKVEDLPETLRAAVSTLPRR